MRRGPDELEIRDPKGVAGGLPSIVTTTKRTLSQMGPRRTIATLRQLNQAGGFDCPGCAWPEPERRSIVEFCENGAKAVAEEATNARVTRSFFARHSIRDLASMSEFELGKAGRLTEPMWRAPGADRYSPISWEDAIEKVGTALRSLDDPNRAVFYTSGRTSNEAAFCYQLLARRLGTNNLPDCSNMCHESSGAALSETIGVGKGSVTLDDVTGAGLILVIGQNPGTNHPRMLTALAEAKRRGAQIVAVNPLREAGLVRFRHPQHPRDILGHGVDLADVFLQIRVNGDLALFQALGHLLLAAHERGERTIDEAFIAQYCDGFAEYEAARRELDWAEVEAATGLERTAIEQVAALIGARDRIVVCWAMGLTQHKNSVPTIREVVNVLLLRGAVGRPGAGLCPVRGHSNVQGDRTMGITEKPSPGFVESLGEEFSFQPPSSPGYDVVEAIRAMRDGKVSVFVAMGGNFASATPDTEVTEAALARCGLTVHVSTKLNRSHAVPGREALILPCLGRTERDESGGVAQFVTVEDSMSMVHESRGALHPASPLLRSEVAIVCAVAREALGESDPVEWERLAANYGAIRDHIARVVPGFEDFNARVRRPSGFVLPHPPRDQRVFPTASGKARFTVNDCDVVEVAPGHLLMQTIRSHDQYNTTIYGFDDRYRGIKGGRRVVLVHPDDVAELGLSDGMMVDLVSDYGATPRRAPAFRVVSYPTAKGCCATYFPEANVLVPLDHTAAISNTPASKSVVVALEPAVP